MKRILTVIAMTTLLGGCMDETVTELDKGHTDSVEPSGLDEVAVLDTRADALGGIDDALDRIMPALSDQTAAHSLAVALSGLRTALANANQTGIPSLIDAAQAAVDRYARTGFDAADLDAVRLALDYARVATESATRVINQ